MMNTDTNKKRRFEVDFLIDGQPIDSAIIKLDDRVITRVDDEWRDSLYPLYTPEDIAEHVAYNLIVNRIWLSQMDGWADMPNSYAEVIKWPSLEGYDIQAREIAEVGNE